MTKDDIAAWLDYPVTRRFMEGCRTALNKSLVDVHGCVVNANQNQAALEAGKVLALQYILSKDFAGDLVDETEDGDG